MNIINFLETYFPKFFKLSSELNRHILKLKFIKNVHNTNFEKNALLSYITEPFERNSISHTNFFEAQSWAKILCELGYNVDVIPYNSIKRINFNKYDLICGFGEVFQKYFESNTEKNIKTIYYGTGMHMCHQNNETLKRLKQTFIKKGKWFINSSRYVEKAWTYQTMLVDGIIVLGNNVCVESYSRYYDGPIYGIPSPFYKTQDGYQIHYKRSENIPKNFLWFGSTGLIHKGLDLVLEFFSNNPEFKLHVCGPIKNEQEFEKEYFKELYQTENIITHGFVDISSENFRKILLDCSFVVFPSCSEGGCPSVITAIGNGALVPIITKETSMSTGSEIWIADYTVQDIENAVTEALSYADDKLITLQKENIDYVMEHHSQENYYKTLKNAVTAILRSKNEL